MSLFRNYQQNIFSYWRKIMHSVEIITIFTHKILIISNRTLSDISATSFVFSINKNCNLLFLYPLPPHKGKDKEVNYLCKKLTRITAHYCVLFLISEFVPCFNGHLSFFKAKVKFFLYCVCM